MQKEGSLKTLTISSPWISLDAHKENWDWGERPDKLSLVGWTSKSELTAIERNPGPGFFPLQKTIPMPLWDGSKSYHLPDSDEEYFVTRESVGKKKTFPRSNLPTLGDGQAKVLALRFYISDIRDLLPLVRVRKLFLDRTCQRYKPWDGQGHQKSSDPETLAKQTYCFRNKTNLRRHWTERELCDSKALIN